MSEPRFELSGGRLCLDFSNTVSDWFADERRDRLEDYGALVAFAEQAGAIDPRQARALRRVAGQRPTEAEAAVVRARELRQAIFHVFHALGHGGARHRRRRRDHQRLSRRARRRLRREAGGWRLDFERDGADLEAPLSPIAVSAAELLTSTRADRVRICGAEETGCTWLFVDESKNRSRRWCSMSDCGNRAKARRHYEKLSGRAP
jgi:predicted RNA-binding Zn ribbon-like protein